MSTFACLLTFVYTFLFFVFLRHSKFSTKVIKGPLDSFDKLKKLTESNSDKKEITQLFANQFPSSDVNVEQVLNEVVVLYLDLPTTTKVARTWRAGQQVKFEPASQIFSPTTAAATSAPAERHLVPVPSKGPKKTRRRKVRDTVSKNGSSSETRASVRPVKEEKEEGGKSAGKEKQES